MVKILFQTFLLLGTEWVLWLLFILSVTALAIVLNRWRYLSNQEKIGARLWKDRVEPWFKASQSNDWKAQAEKISTEYPCVESRMMQSLARTNTSNTTDPELIVSSVMTRERLSLEKYMSVLGTLGNNAPFIGLFGTVLGIIRAFHDLGSGMDSGGIATVSSGLAEALVTTAMGLMVAIPSVMFYNYFQRKIKNIMARADSLSSFLLGSK